MSQCTFCKCQIEEGSGFFVPSHAMMYGLQTGFSPERMPCWPAMKEAASVNAIDTYYTPEEMDRVISTKWRELLSAPGRQFPVCEACFPAVAPFLPKNPHAMPQNPHMMHHGVLSAAQHTPGLDWIVPVDVSSMAVLAGYCGLFAPFLCFIPAPLALLFGWLGLNDIRQNPQKRGRGRAIFGIVMGTIWMIGLMLMIASSLVG